MFHVDVDPGWFPLAWFDSRAGLCALWACGGACAAREHAFALISISTVYTHRVPYFRVFSQVRSGCETARTTCTNGAGSSPAAVHARDDDDDDDDDDDAAAAAAAAARLPARTLDRPLPIR